MTVLARFERWITATWCGLRHGHALVRTFKPRRLGLECSSCGWCSPGIDL